MLAGEQSTTVSEPIVARELRELVARAKGGDATVLPTIRRILDDHPEIAAYVGDVARLAESVWIEMLVAEDPLGAEAIKRNAAQMRAELEGPHPTRLERLLIAQVISTLLEVAYAQMAAAQRGGSVMQANLRVRRSEVAQRKHLAALKALAQIRTLLPQGLVPVGSTMRLHDGDRETA